METYVFDHPAKNFLRRFLIQFLFQLSLFPIFIDTVMDKMKNVIDLKLKTLTITVY